MKGNGVKETVNKSQASVAALDFVACLSKKAANIHNRWLSCRRQRSLRSPHGQYKIVLEEDEHMGPIKTLLMFALFEDVSFSFCETAGYVRFALFTSGYGYSPSSRTTSAKRLRAYGAQKCIKTSAKRDVKTALRASFFYLLLQIEAHAHTIIVFADVANGANGLVGAH